jgi:pimeloyl-ACP methyl ester carboxylesterase
MNEWSSGYVDGNGIRMHYYRTGGEKPPLVLAHGATDDGLCWTRVARALEQDYDVIMPDARGHGLSDAPAQGYTAADHAGDLAGLIRGLDLDHPAVGGHSMGAGATLQLVADYPELVRSAFLEDPGFRLGDGAVSRPGNELRNMVVEGRQMGRQALIDRGRARSPLWDADEFGAWADAKLRVSDQFLDTIGTFRGAEWQQVLPRVKRPLLLITSDPDKGAIVTPEAAAEAKRLLPGLEVKYLPGAGHNIRREQFDAFVITIREFLSVTAEVVTAPS